MCVSLVGTSFGEKEIHPVRRTERLSVPVLLNREASSFYYAEEILSTKEYTRTIKANDRATMLNLMIGLNGYTLCSGIICEELNGDDYLAIPFEEDSVEENSGMEIGYITRQNTILSSIGKLYIDEIRKYLGIDEL